MVQDTPTDNNPVNPIFAPGDIALDRGLRVKILYSSVGSSILPSGYGVKREGKCVYWVRESCLQRIPPLQQLAECAE